MENYDETLLNTKSDFNNNKEIYAASVKCVFVKPKNIRGAFRLLLRRHDSKIIELLLWTTRTVPEEMELELSMPSEEFSTKISSIGPVDKQSSEKLSIALREKLTKEIIDSVFEDHESYLASFKDMVKELFEKNLRYAINVDMKFEPFDQERLKKSGYEREEASSNTTVAENVSMSKIMADSMVAQVITCSGIVDPVNGIAASQLKEGDIVEVVLPANSTIGAFLLDYCAKLDKIPEFPVKKVSMSENGAYIIDLEADGNVTCVVKTTSDLRLRAKKGYPLGSSVSGQKLMIIIGAGIAVLVLGLIALITLLVR